MEPPPDARLPPEHDPLSPPSPLSPSQDGDGSAESSSDINLSQSQSILDEDDHFGQLVFSLGDVDFPPDLILSEETFNLHIDSHSQTMVAFYVPCEPFNTLHVVDKCTYTYTCS